MSDLLHSLHARYLPLKSWEGVVEALQGSTWRVGENLLTGCGRDPGFLGIYIDFRLDRDPFIISDWESDLFLWVFNLSFRSTGLIPLQSVDLG